jgi:hypothetical protein
MFTYVGVIAHGLEQIFFLDDGRFGKDTNLTINAVLKTLLRYTNSNADVLYLQADNCGGENKNRHFFAFASFLVHIGLFRKVKVYFIYVLQDDGIISTLQFNINRSTFFKSGILMKTLTQCLVVFLVL